eukprot:CAMPEP_0119555116 /NCGR_PEP_ID=MMETSP1352-20130426/7427_1 /TAXON_ID=265584 /ORGANISM="Stauroneis constricta, Strain CCMP1120" /LENGTH=610 /DNA_ID=CAMNT_0007601829 /DNA_START=521 /DNA_END=2353 /DNA_ORIENTATION=-
MSNEVQKPLFAAASSQGQNQQDDFDLNEIFQDYFISEGFEDPLNAYTSSMANYGGGAASVAITQQAVAGAPATAVSTAPAPMQTNQGMAMNTMMAPVPAPTPVGVPAPAPMDGTFATTAPVAAAPGGIAGMGIATQYQQQQQQQLQFQQQQQQQIQQQQQQQQQQPAAQNKLPTGGIKTTFHATAVNQAAAMAGMPGGGEVQHFQHAAPPTKRTKIQAPLAAPSVGGLTSRLGVPLPMAMAGMPGAGIPQLATHAATSGISLPIGVGIRLGGTGGVAPAKAQAARTSAPGQFQMWGAAQEGAMTDQAIAERRLRNREHAKRSRVRKKFMLESMQEQVLQLQKENQRLRTLVQDNIPEHAQKIISECCQSSPLFADTEGQEEPEKKSSTTLVKSDFSLMESLSSGQQNFVLSDPRLPDNPIVFATPGFYKLTGYTQEQVLGRNCRFLQGPGTNPKHVDIIRKAIATGSDCTTCILNYKADGTPFWNQFFVAALRDSDNCIVNYVGVQTEIEPEMGANALEDRVNAVLPLQAKEDENGEESTDAPGAPGTAAPAAETNTTTTAPAAAAPASNLPVAPAPTMMNNVNNGANMVMNTNNAANPTVATTTSMNTS